MTAGAAFTAFFFLPGIKIEDVLRCGGVALLAGFFWRPVSDAGKDNVLNKGERTAEGETAGTFMRFVRGKPPGTQ